MDDKPEDERVVPFLVVVWFLFIIGCLAATAYEIHKSNVAMAAFEEGR